MSYSSTLLNEAFEKKLLDIEKLLSEDKGEFSLFALINRDNDFWDLVVSAIWLEDNIRSNLDYIFDTLKKHLSKEEFLFISRVVIIPLNDSIVINFNSLFLAKHNLIKLINITINELKFEFVLLITSQSATNISNFKSKGMIKSKLIPA